VLPLEYGWAGVWRETANHVEGLLGVVYRGFCQGLLDGVAR
jgi:hypothetical protein